MLKGSTDGNDYDITDTQSDIIEELIHVETNEIVLNKSSSKPEKPNQIQDNNQNEDLNQREVQIEPSPHNLRKIECTHCKHYIYM